MKLLLLFSVLLSFSDQALAYERLFNNAEKGGLTGEGLRTRTRPEGGWYSELFPGNAATAASFRMTTYHLADDFGVEGARWRVREIRVWGYQDNLHYPSVDRGFVEIRKGSYTGPIVAVAEFARSEMTDIYRIFTGRPNDMFQCQRLTFETDVVLSPGTYWIVLGAMGVVNVNGPWCPFLTPTDSPTVPGANAMGRLSGTHLRWVQLFDPGDHHVPLDLPFWIDGERLPLKGAGGEPMGPPYGRLFPFGPL